MNQIPTLTIQGIDKPVSRLVLGIDNKPVMDDIDAMMAAFMARGGNCVDTAYIYAGGAAEPALGAWLARSGKRNQIVLLDKGAHTPHCNPECLRSQHLESLKRLQTDHVDIYMMHRDNPDVPIGEFMDVMHAFVQQGSMRVLGASNWTLQRIQEAQAYAAKHGKTPFSAISNNYSLARMVEPPWAGCMAATEPAFKTWLQQAQMPVMPWSSQARGFFLDDTTPDYTADPERVRCWFAADNFARLQRARSLAAKNGVQAINIALAWVLAQPFPTLPLIGPRTMGELQSSLRALDVTLTADDVAWLNLGL